MIMLKRILQYPLLVIFAIFIVCFSVFDMTQNKKAYSEFENRDLAQRPTFSIASFIDTTFSKNYTTYVNDQFWGRDFWINLKAVTELALGKTENNGVLYGKDGYMFEKLQIVEERPAGAGTNVVAQNRFNRSVNAVKEFLGKYDMPITVSIVPNSSEILKDKLPSGYTAIDQNKYINEIYQQFPQENNTFLNFYDALTAHDNEYIYYHTDHHWTTLGAYYAYEAYCTEKGLTPVPLDSLEANYVEDFYGTFYNKAKKPGSISDTITWYDVPVESCTFSIDDVPQNAATIAKGTLLEEEGMTMLSVDTMCDTEKFDTRDKYAALMWGNPGIMKIKSSHNLDHQDGKTSRLLLIKDSYANSMIPYLTYNYDEIYVIDLRYFPLKQKFGEFLLSHEFSDIFVMYNFSTFISDDGVVYLKY